MLPAPFWKRMKTASLLQRATRGYEFVAMIPVVILGIYLAFLLSGLAEVNLFAGDFKTHRRLRLFGLRRLGKPYGQNQLAEDG